MIGWAVIQVRDGEGLLYAYGKRLTESENIAHFVRECEGIIAMSIVDTKKKMEAIVRDWNDAARRNGEYMFTW